jgi:hypothetical protein
MSGITEPVERMWVGDPDTPENQRFVPPPKRTFTVGQEPAPEPAPPEPAKPDIDQAIADRQPRSRLNPAQKKRRGKIGDIGVQWGYVLPPMPKDLPDEEIDAYLDRLYDDLQHFIAQKRRKQYW